MATLTDTPVAARAPRQVSFTKPLIYVVTLVIVGLTAAARTRSSIRATATTMSFRSVMKR